MIIKLVFLLSSIGFLISAYLLWTYTTGTPIACSAGGCEIVRESPYSYIFGIPQPLLGILFYLALMFLIIGQNTFTRIIKIRTIYLYIALTGFGFIYSLYLSYLEAFVIKAFCVWCVASGIIATSLFLIFLSGYYGKFFKI
jgi:uncharacterized membrane protein